MRVYPVAGIRVRDPVKRDFLPDAGREVGDNDFYWHRRIKDGDVVTQQPAAPASAARVVQVQSSRSDDA